MPEKAFGSSKSNNQYAGVDSLLILPRQYIKERSQCAPAGHTRIRGDCLELRKTPRKKKVEEVVKI